MLFRREVFEAARPFPERWMHDEWLAIVAAALGRVELRREVLTGYRQHGANHAGIRSNGPVNRLRKVRKLFVSRAGSHETLLRRSEALVAHLERRGADAEKLFRARQNLCHDRHRSALPRLRPLRVAPVLREWRTGRYVTYDYGRADAVRDLLQSAR
jgi:hypothetical protein